MNTIIRWVRGCIGVVHGLIHFRDVANEAARLNLGILTRTHPVGWPRDEMLSAPVTFSPETRPVLSSTDEPFDTGRAHAVGSPGNSTRRDRTASVPSIREHVLEHRQGEVSCTPA